MSAGPPRFGLFPRTGLFPGADTTQLPPSEYREITRPSTTIKPGRGLRIHKQRRYITRPSTTIKPGPTLTIRTVAGPSTTHSGTFLVKGQGRFSFISGPKAMHRKISLQGTGGLYVSGTVSSVLETILGVAVPFASATRTAFYRGGARIANFVASSSRKVDF